mmetsp:Transcript_52338/g.111222  ORF Transcript_52338/g.111222 Transcript_52338/m.111222 type:complete len:410 (+) Transcript_52338:271-1500(+)|eukprot:CAMPEP_0172551784 /NCGR_PEP_ID=MMETSP1067-20121228/41004_1 /TAXON_ID=265564 ORGANISM="Thalassiosira punctigera, Strain Tpunct2005C2" /NCGR_SAMPLE_ID=MMETSP1067 /ASSEMBLY_ACC=CAM_ASM_000444 /LENGTH=409 /DNA_ID=CAMNT_0013339619 /DNA_START=208 /DNA_END=1437 /DNA_ORIENTATION=+
MTEIISRLMTASSLLLLALLSSTTSVRTASAFVTPASTLQQRSDNLLRNNAAPPPSASSSSSSSTALRMEVIECDVAIVGGGPAGCTCALYTSRADLSTVILDKNPASGALAITSHIANYPGVDRTMSGAELLERMKDQAVQYGTRYERAQVFMIDVKSDETGDERYTKCVYTPDYTVKARSLVLATGAMGRVGKPFPGEKELLGSGVSYCATCDGAFYRDAVVAVYGASTEAIEEALYLTKFAKTLHWITSVDISRETESGLERNKVLDQDLLAQLYDCENVEHLEQTRLVEVQGDPMTGVTGVKVRRRGAQEDELIEVEGAFIYGAGGGSKPMTDFCQSKVELDESGGVIVDEDMKTSCDGVFAIGDIRNTDYKQVVVAASDGCIAAMSIEKFLNNRKMVKVDWIHK